MTADDWPRRISLFTLGLTFAGCGGFAAWLAYALLTMKMNPELAGPAYWREVGNRAANNPAVVAVIGSGCVAVVAGVVLIARSFVRRPPTPGGPP